jgi:hypothetical protein
MRSSDFPYIDAVDGSSTSISVPWMWALLRLPPSGERTIQTIRTIGFDMAKSVFQVPCALHSGHIR